MASTPHGWRMLTAILQIAAFVLFVLPAPAAAHRHAGVRDGIHHGHHAAAPTASAADPADAAPDAAGAHDGCRLGCCACHALMGAASITPAPTGWTARRLPVPAPDVTRPDAAPEALPEPPRHRA